MYVSSTGLVVDNKVKPAANSRKAIGIEGEGNPVFKMIHLPLFSYLL